MTFACLVFVAVLESTSVQIQNRHYDRKFVPNKIARTTSVIKASTLQRDLQYEMWCGYGTDLFRYGSFAAILRVKRANGGYRANNGSGTEKLLQCSITLTAPGQLGTQLLEILGFSGCQGTVDIFQLEGAEPEFRTQWTVGDMSSPALYSGDGSIDPLFLTLLEELVAPSDAVGKSVGDSWTEKLPGLSGAEDGDLAQVLAKKYEATGTFGKEAAARISVLLKPKKEEMKWVIRATQYLNPASGVLVRFDGRYHDGSGNRVTLSLRLIAEQKVSIRHGVGNLNTLPLGACP